MTMTMVWCGEQSPSGAPGTVKQTENHLELLLVPDRNTRPYDWNYVIKIILRLCFVTPIETVEVRSPLLSLEFGDWFNSMLSLNTFENIIQVWKKNPYLIMINQLSELSARETQNLHNVKNSGSSLATKLRPRNQHYVFHGANSSVCSALMLRNKQERTVSSLNCEQMDLETSNVKLYKAALNSFNNQIMDFRQTEKNKVKQFNEHDHTGQLLQQPEVFSPYMIP